MIRTLRAPAAPLACALIFILGPTAAPAQETPVNLTANKPVLLRATTPLGEAGIEIAAGTALTNFEIQGDKVRVWQGPFTATVALADVQPPAPEPAPTPAPTPPPMPTPDTTPTPDAAPLQSREPSPAWILDSVSWPSWVFPAAVGALSIYALLATLALIRLRHTRPPETPPYIMMPKPGSARSAIVSNSGIHCPLCNAEIPIEQLVIGRNTCPSCKGGFVCE